MIVDFNLIPEDSRIWVYQCSAEFSSSDIQIIEKKLSFFLSNWKAHDNELQTSFLLLHNRFLIIAVNEDYNSIGGCSIDYSLKLVKEISADIGKNLLDRLTVNYKLGSSIKSINLKALKNAIKNGTISSETTIFNTIVNTKKELLNNFEIKLGSSWLSKFV